MSYVLPTKRTSRLGLSLLVLILAAVIPVLIYTLSNLPSDNIVMRNVLTWDAGVILTLIPITLYLVIQSGNKISIDSEKQMMSYRTAWGSAVSFYYSADPDKSLHIIYFSDTSAQSVFNKKGWACFYRGGELMFRLSMERWDVDDLWWISQNIPSRIMVIHQRTRHGYIEKRFPGYFPMFAEKPVLSGLLTIIGVSGGIVIELIMWALSVHFTES